MPAGGTDQGPKHCGGEGVGPLSYKSYQEFFRFVTGRDPYPYQQSLAECDEWPQVLHIPTGAGKTAAVGLAWLWRRCYHPDPAVRQATPRRLVYCLPMRVLVEQTRDTVRSWLGKLGLQDPAGLESGRERPSPGLPGSGGKAGVGVHVLMGGEEPTDWAVHPEQNAILIGTQDMLLSRALNRGYAASRYRWPREFGLLNNDVLWVLDEIQLMGVGLVTTAQLDGLRRSLGTFGPARSIWMSATLDPAWLGTVDHPVPLAREILALTEADRAHPDLARKWQAPKSLQFWREAAPVDKHYAARLAAFVADCHVQARQQATTGTGVGQTGPLTLVILNTVPRAQAVYAELVRLQGNGGNDRCIPSGRSGASPSILLLHSRFRPYEREQRVAELLTPPGPGGRILVATQAVEAGVDISARVLITELAPWSSLVQRFGRCNRRGEYGQAAVWVVDLLAGGATTKKKARKENVAAPYSPEDLAEARDRLRRLHSVSLADLDQLPVPATTENTYPLRRRDLLDLFDTTPDLSGSDIDVSRFVRDSEDRDAQVYWRLWPGAQEGKAPGTAGFAPPQREELCPVPVYGAYGLQEFLRGLKGPRARLAWVWDPLEDKWETAKADQVRAGMTVLLAAQAGGYSLSGWDPAAPGPVDPIPVGRADQPASTRARPGQWMGGDESTAVGRWQSLAEHDDAVGAALEQELDNLSGLALPSQAMEALRLAARWHDAGKAHPVFQETLRLSNRDCPPPDQSTAWAKSPGQGGHHARKYFRHELASALAFLESPAAYNELPEGWRDLAAYLIAAHHGKVRLAIRSLPGEEAPANVARHALGVWEGDPLPDPALPAPVQLGGGAVLWPLRLSLAPMELGFGADGCPSWQERMLRLVTWDALGPFRLAYLEALLTAADARGSASACAPDSSPAGSAQEERR
ncbi:MAG: CRISPR-associated endonuclease Cas3'' [Firmicutes bacterium]|nr:CRISPR-associated endonuclease Cas3'' [Bacillota bacterium]